jgi:ATP-dependent helicase/nuclease subunit B
VLTGRIDRLDRSSAGLGIVDYKTGALPDREALHSGENCQLLHYALLVDEPVEQVALLGLLPDGLRDQVHIDGQALAELTHAVGRRALRLKGALDAGASLPAWGDSESCARCEMSGVCRKEYWCATPMDR